MPNVTDGMCCDECKAYLEQRARMFHITLRMNDLLHLATVCMCQIFCLQPFASQGVSIQQTLLGTRSNF